MGGTIYLKPIAGLDLGGADKAIREAYECLKRAALLLRLSETRPKPFRISKIMNMMSKTTYGDSCVLGFLLGEIDPEKEPEINIEIKTHAVMLLMAQLEEEG